MAMRVVIQPVTRSGQNGDRDPHRHPYRDFNIHLVGIGVEEISAKTLVHQVVGFDYFWSSIKNRDDVEREARNYARQLSRRVNAGGVITLKEKADA